MIIIFYNNNQNHRAHVFFLWVNWKLMHFINICTLFVCKLYCTLCNYTTVVFNLNFYIYNKDVKRDITLTCSSPCQNKSSKFSQSLSPQKMTTNLCHLEMITLMINYLMAYFTLTCLHKCITGIRANRLCCWNNLCVILKQWSPIRSAQYETLTPQQINMYYTVKTLWIQHDIKLVLTVTWFDNQPITDCVCGLWRFHNCYFVREYTELQ